MDRFKEWTYPAADLPDAAVDRDLLLTNVMLYWLTGTAGSSARLFKETSNDVGPASEPSAVPMGVAVFPAEHLLSIRRLAERAYNIVHWSEFDRGGHFPAMEVPELLVEDLRRFFRQFR